MRRENREVCGVATMGRSGDGFGLYRDLLRNVSSRDPREEQVGIGRPDWEADIVYRQLCRVSVDNFFSKKCYFSVAQAHFLRIFYEVSVVPRPPFGHG